MEEVGGSSSTMMDSKHHEDQKSSHETDESDLNFEVPDDDECTPQPVYQVQQKLEDKFLPLSAKEVIHNVLYDSLSKKEFKEEEAKVWSTQIANDIRIKMKEMKFKNYKYVVNVVLGEKKGAGLKIGSRCIWDAASDTYAHDNFVNDTIFCVAIVYAVYHY